MSAASLACLQQIYIDGLFHPTVTSSMASPLYQNNFSTSAILQQPASIKANLTCTCGQFYDNPCRMEMRTVRRSAKLDVVVVQPVHHLRPACLLRFDDIVLHAA